MCYIHYFVTRQYSVDFCWKVLSGYSIKLSFQESEAHSLDIQYNPDFELSLKGYMLELSMEMVSVETVATKPTN